MTQIDKNIALNLKRIRKIRNLSLDMLAEQTGVSKSMLGQIERGESNPTISTIGKIVDGLHVPFEQLIYNRSKMIKLPHMENAPVYRELKGVYCIHRMLPYEAGRSFEICQGTLEPGGIMEDGSHGEQAWEYLTVIAGTIELLIGDEQYRIEESSSLYFACDRPHLYQNRETEQAIINMLLTREQH